jgi:hypothetical protein
MLATYGRGREKSKYSIESRKQKAESGKWKVENDARRHEGQSGKWKEKAGSGMGGIGLGVPRVGKQEGCTKARRRG